MAGSPVPASLAATRSTPVYTQAAEYADWLHLAAQPAKLSAHPPLVTWIRDIFANIHSFYMPIEPEQED